MDETRLYFAVGGWGENPAVVTDLIGVSPTRVRRRGDPLSGRNDLRARHELWALDSGLPLSASFEDHLSALLGQLERNPDGARAVIRQFGAVLQCASRFETANPGFALPATLVARAASLGLGFDFDLYVLPEADSDEWTPATPEQAGG